VTVLVYALAAVSIFVSICTLVAVVAHFIDEAIKQRTCDHVWTTITPAHCYHCKRYLLPWRRRLANRVALWVSEARSRL
jgi:hypothetical protein